jgi:hypothetical protein
MSNYPLSSSQSVIGKGFRSIDAGVIPGGPFSGGSAPLLQDVVLDGVPFPELSNFLSSSHRLSITSPILFFVISLIPESGYISPEAMP